MKETSKDNHYVDKEVILRDIVSYQSKCREHACLGKPKPKIPDSIGKVIIDIAKGMASRPNFRGYTYIDEMQADAIVDCVKAVPLFDVTKSENPFGFFSQIVWYAFLGRLAKEKKQQLAKIQMISDPSTGLYSVNDGDERTYGDAKDDLLNFYHQGKNNV